MEVNIKNIFKAFFKIGAILLGGGYVIVPIMKEELVEKRNWLKEEEIYDYLCVSQCLPGIIAVNMSVLTGYKLLKFRGAVIALFAMSLSPFLSIVLIANILSNILNIPFMTGLFWGVNLSVIILIYLTLKEVWKKSIIDVFTYFWFFLILALSLYKISPVILILSSILLGAVIQFIKEKKNV